MSLALGLAAHQADRAVRHRVHGVWARRIGFQPEVVSVRECQDEQAVADLIFQSSCTPPALPLCYRDQGPVLDGGVVDAAFNFDFAPRSNCSCDRRDLEDALDVREELGTLGGARGFAPKGSFAREGGGCISPPVFFIT